MAINRFMQPWKRDFSSEQYTPDFAAWAQALQKKDMMVEKGFAEIDSLAEKIPLAGLATEDARNALVQSVKAQSAQLAEQLSETGDVGGVRRASRKLASDILGNPWTNVFAKDRAMMEYAMKTMTLPGFERSVNYFTDQYGKVKQLTDPSQWKDDYYRTIMPADAIPEYQKKFEHLKHFYKKWTEDGSTLEVQEDPDTGFKAIFRKRKDGVIEKITLDMAKDFLTKDINGMDFLDLGLANPEGPGRLFDEGKFEQVNGRKFNKEEYLQRLLIAGMPLYYEKSDISTTYVKVGTISTGKDSDKSDGGQGKTPDVVLSSQTRSMSMLLDNVPEDAEDLYLSYSNFDRKIQNIDKTVADEMNKRYAEALKIQGDNPIFIKNSEGLYELNSKLPWNTILPQATDANGNPIPQDATLQDRLNKYTNPAANDATYLEELTALNSRIAQLKSQKTASDIVFNEAGITETDIAKYEKIRKEVYDAYYSSANRSYGGAGDVATPGGWQRYVDPSIEANLDAKVKEKLKELPEFKRIQKILDSRRENPVTVAQAKYWDLVALTSKGESFSNGLDQVMYSVLENALKNQTIKNHATDKLIVAGTSDINDVSAFLNEYLPEGALGEDSKPRGNFVRRASIKIAEDNEDGYIAVYRLKGAKGQMTEYEVKLPEDFKIYYADANGVTKEETITQAFGIDNAHHARRFTRTQQIAEQWQTNNGYYIYSSATDGEKDGITTYTAHLDTYRADSKGDKVTIAVSHLGRRHTLNLQGGARQVALVEEILEDAKRQEKTEYTKDITRNQLLKLGITEGQAETLTNEFLGTTHGVEKPYYLHANSGYRTIDNRMIIVDKGMKMELDPFKEAIGNDNMLIIGGYRSPEKNKQVKGKENSDHLTGNAVDFRYSKEVEEIIRKKYNVALKHNVEYQIPGTNLYIMVHVDTEGGIPIHFHMERKIA